MLYLYEVHFHKKLPIRVSLEDCKMTAQLSPEEREINIRASRELTPGKYYLFQPYAEATAHSVCDAFKPQLLRFTRGRYISYDTEKEIHIFDGRPMYLPEGVDKQFSLCFFQVMFTTSGSFYEKDLNQQND